MKDWFVVVVFVVITLLIMTHLVVTTHIREDLIIKFGEEMDKRDTRMHDLHNRLKDLEDQRDLERRITDLEILLRTYCLDGKTEMCGKIGPVKR